jgi:polysaccharide biosynthesis/export protein
MKYLTALVLVASFCTACQPERQSDPNAPAVFRRATPHEVAATEYRIAPPDKLLIRAPGLKELDNLTPTIRPDGRIALNLLGEIDVNHQTPAELSAKLNTLAARYYATPDIRVELLEPHSKFYAVTGIPLRNGGRKPFTGRDTVIAALVDSGFTPDTWPQQVHLSRPDAWHETHTTVIIDFKHMSETGDLTQNYLLNEGDILYVKNSPLAQFRVTTQNLLAPINQSAGTAQTLSPTAR